MGLSFSGALTPTGSWNTKTNIPPVWNTAANLGQTQGNLPFTANLSASDLEGSDLVYSVYGGSLPSGLSLSAAGVITGTPLNLPGVYTFPIAVSDGADYVNRTFSLELVNTTPIWTTAAGNLGSFGLNSAINITLLATDPNNDTVSYSVTAGALPTGVTLNSVTGVISGTTSQEGTFNFTVGASDGIDIVNRGFSFISQPSGDQYWSNVVMMLPLTTNTNDIFGRTITNNGASFNGVASEGGTCINFTTTNRLTVSDPTTLTFSGDFTIECFVKPTAKIPTNNYAQYVMYTNNAGYTNSFYFGYLRSDPNFGSYLGFHSTTGANIDQFFNLPGFSFTSWHHMAVVRSGSTLYFFHDGALLNSWTNVTQTLTFQNSCIIGNDGSSFTEPLNGYMEHLRFTNGVARYTSAFTVPTAPLLIGPVWSTAAGALSPAPLKSPYSVTLAATGTGVNYVLQSGSLPAGITLNGSTGVLSGSATAIGSASFTIRAAVTNGTYVDRSFSILVNQMLVAVSNNSANYITSWDNGINWTQRTLPSSQQSDVIWTGSNYVTLNYALNTTIALTSNDGINWTTRTLPTGSGVSGYWVRHCYNGSKIVAVCQGTASKGAYSTDGGLTWNVMTLPSSAAWTSVEWTGTKFVVVDQQTSSNKGAYSSDGINWTATTLPISSAYAAGSANNGTKAVFIAKNTNPVMTTDGINWTTGTMPTAWWYDICYNTNLSLFCAVAYNTNIAATSPDGIAWTQRTLPVTANWAGISFTNSGFVAVAAGGTVAATSPDGITWTQRTVPTGSWYEVCSNS